MNFTKQIENTSNPDFKGHFKIEMERGNQNWRLKEIINRNLKDDSNSRLNGNFIIVTLRNALIRNVKEMSNRNLKDI